MDRVYLGLFSTIFEWIWDSILKPVVDFVGGLLNTILSLLFDKVLMPMLINVFFPMFKSICEMVFNSLCDILFEAYVTVLRLVDYLSEIFNIFGGITQVQYKQNDMYILSALFAMTPVMKLVWLVAGISFFFLLIFSMVSVIRSMGELGNEVQRPVTKVLKSTWDGFLKMFSTPFICVALIMIMQVILVSVYTGIQDSDDVGNTGNKGSQTTIGRWIFVVSTLNAASNSQYNISTASESMRETLGVNDSVRAQYYYTDYKENGINAAKDYSDLSTVKKDFNAKDIDFLIGGAMALLFAFTLGRGALTFIGRIFNIIVLTIVAPIFGSTIPLDDGQRYEKWKDMYVGQLFSGFGLVLSMEIYLLLVPVFMDMKLEFGTGTTEANYLIRIIFLAAGAYMVMQVGPVITGLVSQSAASAESTANRTFGGALFAAASYAKGKIVGDKSKGVRTERIEDKSKNPFTDKGKGNKSDAKKDGKAGDGKSANTKAADAMAGKKSASDDVHNIASKRMEDDEKANKGTKVQLKTKQQEQQEAKEREAEKPKNAKEAAEKAAKGPGVKKSFLGGIFVKGKGKDGKEHWGVNLGSKFNFGLKEDGSVSGNVFGISWKKGKDGKVDKVSIPFMRLKRGEDGKMHISKIKLSKGMQLRRTESVETDKDGNITKRKLGGLYVSDLSAIGMKRRFDASTGKVETQSMLGTHYRREIKENADGTKSASYVKSYRNFLGSTSVYDRDKEGKYHVTARKGFLSDKTYKLDKKTGKKKLLKQRSMKGLYNAEFDDDEEDDDDGDEEE